MRSGAGRFESRNWAESAAKNRRNIHDKGPLEMDTT